MGDGHLDEKMKFLQISILECLEHNLQRMTYHEQFSQQFSILEAR